MKLAAPAVPKDWRLHPLEGEGVRATVTRYPPGGIIAALLLLGFWLHLTGNGELPWLMAAAPFLAVLVHCVDLIGFGLLGTEVWHLSQRGLHVRKVVLGFTWSSVAYERGTLSVVNEVGSIWDLRFQGRDGKTQALFRSETLDDVLGLAALLEEKLGWSLCFTEAIPQFFRPVVELALETQDRERIRLLLRDEQLVVVLVRATRAWGPHFRPRLRAVLRSLEAEAACLSALAEQAGPEARAGAVELLGDLDHAPALAVLRRALTDEYGPVRVRATEALGRLRDRESVPTLCASLPYQPGDHYGSEVRQAAVEALGKIGDARATHALSALLSGPERDTDAGCRQAVALALGRIKDPAAVSVLGEALQDVSLLVGEAAAEALGEVGALEAVPLLAAALADPDGRVAWRAAASLGRLRHPSALPALTAMLSGERIALRAEVVRAVAAIGGAPAIEALCGALSDTAHMVRHEAALGLSRVEVSGDGMPIRIRSALPHLRRLVSPLSLESAEVKVACREAIRRIERDTETIKQLPLPAEGGAVEPTSLPLPAAQIAPDIAAELLGVSELPITQAVSGQ